MSALFAAFVLLACGNGVEDTDSGSSAEVQDSANDQALVIGMTGPIDTLNPFNRSAMSSSFAQRFVYESILSRVDAENFEPRLGTMTTEDNQVFTVTIDEDAQWSDGTPVTSADIEYSINTTAHPDTLTSQATHISMLEGTSDDGKYAEGATEVSGVHVVDDKTVEVKTKSAVDMGYMSEFFGYNFLISPKHVFEDIAPADLAMDERVINAEVTNGAYKVVNHAEGDHLELVANPDYHRGEPKIERVFLRNLDSSVIITEMQAGNVHMLAGGGVGVASLNDVLALQEDDKFVVEGATGTGIEYLIPDMRSGRFEDVRTRQALGYATNRELAVENLLHGYGEVPAAPYTSSVSYYNEDVKPYPYDPEKAKELLEAANFDFENPVVLMVADGNESRSNMADLVQQDLEALGMTVVQENYDISTWISRARDGQFDLAMVSMAHSYDPNVASGFHSTGPTNMGAFKDETIDELVVNGNSGTSFEERNQYYSVFQEEVKEKVPALPLFAEQQYKIQVKNLNGGVDPIWWATTANIHEWYFED